MRINHFSSKDQDERAEREDAEAQRLDEQHAMLWPGLLHAGRSCALNVTRQAATAATLLH